MAKFPQIDWDTCTAFDVINHSMRMHPSLFLDALQDAIDAHHSYSIRTYHAETRSNCQRWTKESARAKRRLASGIDAVTACDTFHNSIECFNVACRLQLIPEHCRDAIIQRTEGMGKGNNE